MMLPNLQRFASPNHTLHQDKTKHSVPQGYMFLHLLIVWFLGSFFLILACLHRVLFLHILYILDSLI